MYKMKKRIYTLGVVPGWKKGVKTPILKMTGDWLLEAGFNVGNQFQVMVNEKEIILKKNND